MQFAYRMHKAFINLDPGGSMHFALPPTTGGVILIKADHTTVGGTDQPGDHSASGGGGGGGGRGVWGTLNLDRLHDMQLLRREDGRRVEPGRRASRRRRPREAFDPTNPEFDFEVDGSSGPPAELTMELMLGNQVVQSRTGQNILYETTGARAGWSLRVTRKVVVNQNERRRYRIDAQYPSVLPQLDRRIPMGFLQRGFEQNWNEAGFLEMLRIENKLIQYRWHPKLSELYKLQRENTLKIDIEHVDFPAIVVRKTTLGTGWVQNPIIPPATWAPKTPYVSLRLDLECLDSTTIDATGPDDIELPRRFWAEIRMHLSNVGGIMIYQPHIITSLELERHVLWREVDLPGKIKEKERELFAKQWGENGHNHFDAAMRPWFVGHYEVIEVEYDQATDEIVIWHVGKPVEQEVVASTHTADGGPAPANLPQLFATAEDEKWAPSSRIGVDPRPHRPLRTSPGNLAKVDHIVVLMQENRSFDQVLGYLSRDGLPGLGVQSEVEGLLPEPNARDVNEYRFRPVSDPKKFRSRRIGDTSWPYSLDNPCHSRDCVNAQMSGGMKSFVANYAQRLGAEATEEKLQRIMDYFGPDALPAYAALTREFAVCDHWFGSHIGGTLPNRHIALSGELNRDRQNLPEEENSDFNGYAPSERPTMFDHLSARGVSWKVFEHGYSFLRLYRNYTFDTTNIADFAAFEQAAAQNRLPSVSFIEPDYIEHPASSNDDHCPADMHNGQILVAKTVRALINSGLWEKTLLIITYDEHGGFYDHLFPPDEVEVKAADGTVSMRKIPPLANNVSRLGPRVPAFVISPFVPRGEGKVNVAKDVFEHASIPATILRRFCSPISPPVSARLAAARDVGELLTLPADQPRPKSEFAALLAALNAVATSATRRATGGAPLPVPLRKLGADADSEAFKEDFHGFIAFASATTGLGGR
ncbi:MAG: alkaline phosphatase family protein [Reyranellaceae bacterium]